MESRHGPPALAVQPVGRLIMKFAVPAIISNLISALYNIVDQIFIGQSVGLLGNAATNVAFPLVTLCLSLSLLLGVGGASNYSLAMGRGDEEEAARYYGGAIGFLVIFGLAVGVLVLLFLRPLMVAFGATEASLPYAMVYTGITAFGMPFQIFGTAGSHLIRADGSPRYAMVSISAGAVLNIILDPIFIFTLHLGIAGAAYATVIGQVSTVVLQVFYFWRLKNHPIRPEHLRPRLGQLRAVAGLGSAAFFNQVAMMIVQIAMNNVLRRYGALSAYGSDIPLACVGVITKVNVVMIAFLVGIAQGCQPIVGFNYGAGQYSRVRAAYRRALTAGFCISCAFFLCFQLLPRQLLSIFDPNGSEMFFRFGTEYFRIFMGAAFLNAIHPLTSNFFTSIGRAKMGMLISMTRQLLFLLPLVLLLPRIWGVDGVMIAGPIADAVAAAVALFLVLRELKRIRGLEDRPLREG